MWRASLISLFLLAGLAVAWACGPYFPETLLDNREGAVLAMPRADFEVELRRIAPKAPVFKAVIPAERSHTIANRTAELSDLHAALADRPADARDALINRYARFRTALEEVSEGDPLPAAPANLPAEFDLYARGLRAYRAGAPEEARRHWEAVLALPPEQRRYRSTWAAYMIGRSLVSDDPAQAVRRLVRVRELVEQGYPDPLGLAAASIGWQARAHLIQRQYTEAIRLYLLQHATGDPSAAASLKITAEQVFKADRPVLVALAGDPDGRSLLTAYAVARGGRFHAAPTADQLHAWLHAIERAGVGDVRGADRLAWMAYQAGEMALAQRWVDRAPADAPVAHWVRAKLLLRAGRIDEAAHVLAEVVRLFPPEEQWPEARSPHTQDMEVPYSPAKRAAGELAVLRLTRQQYVDALDLLLRHGFWSDAAYLAESVLTADELKAYVDRHWPQSVTPDNPTGAISDFRAWDVPEYPLRLAANIRYLLARRLTRMGRWKEAGPYYPAALRPRLEAYIAAIRAGHDAQRPAAARAESLWQAARIAREEGMELLGTELAPDFTIYEGAFSRGAWPLDHLRQATDAILTVSRDELDRANRHITEPNRRFHYRYVAADHAWAAADLMPDNDEQTARILCIAGGWLKGRDPQAADRFYKALVTRCPNTSLGRQAREVRWFPSEPSP